jgi:hypothetical protein
MKNRKPAPRGQVGTHNPNRVWLLPIGSTALSIEYLLGMSPIMVVMAALLGNFASTWMFVGIRSSSEGVGGLELCFFAGTDLAELVRRS